jgi:hypothetical protein
VNFHRRGTKDSKQNCPASQNQASGYLGFIFQLSQVFILPGEFSFPSIPANSCFLQLELPKTHQKHDLITSLKKEKKGGV